MSLAPQPTSSALLLLQDGTVFEGMPFAARGTAGGELCFNTGMTGYQEVFTDPSYTGQILIMNNAYIGNYGTRSLDRESEAITIRGLIAKNISGRYSRMLADEGLEPYLVKNNIVCLQGIDTRALVRHIRSHGAMNCVMSSDTTDLTVLQQSLDKVPDMKGLDLTREAGTKTSYTRGDESAKYRIAVLDYGIKQSMLSFLEQHGAFLKIFPGNTGLNDIDSFRPDGVFVSNGPGDPASMTAAVSTIKGILERSLPLFGICLGHQLLALANGIPTYKMLHGHRGLNHPVKNLITGRSEITTQNHGFGIDGDAVRAADHLEITHLNLNDQSVEGIRMVNAPAFSVQYHPESTPGTHDSRYLFAEFFSLIDATNQKGDTK